MLIEFTVGNFRSFRQPVTLSMVAAKQIAHDTQVDANNQFQVDDDLNLLISAVVYGANASGKSNLVAAMAFMRNFVINSAKESQTAESIPVERFRLNVESIQEPALFQVVCLIGEVKYRYGFEVTDKAVVSEWLFSSLGKKEANAKTKRKETRLFTRDSEGIHRGRSFVEAKGVETKTRPNVLFLSALSQWNGKTAQMVIGWFQALGIVSGLDDMGYRGFSLQRFQDGDFRKEMIRFVKLLDLSIDDITSEEVDKSRVNLPSQLPSELKEMIEKSEQPWYSIKTSHKKYDQENKAAGHVSLDFLLNESHGTQKLFFLSGLLLDTLQNGKVLFIDELEARLHPLITCEIIHAFQARETNPRHAQLIFTTHDTNLLSNKIFRRDQIWFTEKDHYEATHLYSLAELKVRNDAAFETNYIQGKYGAIPFLGSVKNIFLEGEP